MYIKKALYK